MSDGERQRQDAVTDEIVQYMRGMISSGQWPVGSKIPSENQLRSTLNVSRTSLRSAIMQLAALNILKAKQGIGTFVIAPMHDEAIFEEAGKNMAAKKEIVQLLEFLKIVAPTAIYVEMRKFNKCFKGLERQLHADLEAQRQLAYQDQAQFMKACFNFHTLIFSAIMNEFVKDSVLEAIKRLQSALAALQPTMSSQVILTLHRTLIQAIEKEDAKLARRVLKKLYTYLTSHDYLRNLGYRAVTKKSEAAPVVEANANVNAVSAMGSSSSSAASAALASVSAAASKTDGQ